MCDHLIRAGNTPRSDMERQPVRKRFKLHVLRLVFLKQKDLITTTHGTILFMIS